jgi:hypothetical protein
VGMEADGDFVIVWSPGGGRRYAADGTPQGSEFGFGTGTGWVYQMAMDADGDMVKVITSRDGSYDIDGQRYAADGTPKEATFQVNTYTPGDQWQPSVAMDADGDFVVVWHSRYGSDEHRDGVFAQRYAADGTPQGGEFQVNTSTSSKVYDFRYPRVAMNASGNFVIVWGVWGPLYDVYARLYR